MKLYVLVVADRHVDPRPFLFTDRDRAISEAREYLAEQLSPEFADDDELGEQETPDGWLFFGRWSHEGDDLWVLECPVDAPVVLD